MSSIAIVVGFAVMLFLPCAIALMGGREPKRKNNETFSPYSDRVVNNVVKAVPAVIEGAPIAKSTAISPAGDAWAEVRDPSLPGRDLLHGLRDVGPHGRDLSNSGMQQIHSPARESQALQREPAREFHQAWDHPRPLAHDIPLQEREHDTYGRGPLNKYLGRVEQAEMDVVRARAVAARAQADALAAVARSAIMQAEAAAAQAEELEDDAAEILRDGRRAA